MRVDRRKQKAVIELEGPGDCVGEARYVRLRLRERIGENQNMVSNGLRRRLRVDSEDRRVEKKD